MKDTGIGRVLVASLHQAIGDVLPNRLDFYENWFNPTRVRDGSIGLAPLTAVLSFLRTEGTVYQEVMTRAGQHAADWTVASSSDTLLGVVRQMPRAVRWRFAVRLARRMISGMYPGSRATLGHAGGDALLEIRGSIFCAVRDRTPSPLCWFYASALDRFLLQMGVAAETNVTDCCATGGSRCAVRIVLPSKNGGRVARAVFFACTAVLWSVSAKAADTGRLLVMPFDTPQGEGRLYWLGEASAVLLTDALTDRGCQAVLREGRLAVFEKLQLPVGVRLSSATVIKVAQLLEATRVISGSVAVSGETLTVRVRDIQVRAARMAPEIVERGSAQELMSIYLRLARRVGSDCAGGRSGQPTDPGLPAFEHYIKGLIAESSSAQLEYLKKALELAPEYHEARLAMAAVLAAAGNHDRAVSELSSVPKNAPQGQKARFAQASSLIELRRYDEAFVVLTGLAEERESAAIQNNLGVVQLRRGSTVSTGRATYFFNKARTTDPDEPDFVFNLGYAYWVERDAPAAAYWLREAVRRNPSDGDAHYVLGAALQATGASLESAREKELARRLSSTYAEWEAKTSGDSVPRGLERTQLALDPPRGERAETVLVRNEQREQRELATFHFDRGRQLFAEHRDEEAISELRRSIYLAPYDPGTHLLLGRIYLRNGKPVDAVNALKISLWSEETADAHVALAEAYVRLNDHAAARVEVKKALDLDPSSVAGRELLDRIVAAERKRN